MEDNIHPVVRLLANRMESHPEEFGHKGSGRWSAWLDALYPLATPEEKQMLRAARMNEIHEEVMDELCNGEERRRAQREEAGKWHVQQQASAAQQAAQLYSQQNAAGSYLNAQPTWTSSVTNHSSQLSSGMLGQIKQALGLK